MPHSQPVVPVTSADGHQFELIHVRAERPSASMFFMPGMGLSARQYIPFSQALATRGIETFIHDWRGLGSSSLRASRGNDWGYPELLELDLIAALEAIEPVANRKIDLAGHSLGSQFACMLAAIRPDQARTITIIAGGAPYWRAFPLKLRLGLTPAYFLMPAIAATVGHYPGRRLGFAGREARSVMSDWARTGRTGRYAAPGIEQDLEQAMAKLQLPVLGIRMTDDWFVPPASLHCLTNKLSACQIEELTIERSDPKTPADHYRWMREPDGVADKVGDFVAA
ncbi:MAG: alpha/beta fold hydrolase [Wenzhouxiangella sp.]